MDDQDLFLAEALCARLCHDLAGPVGAVGTGAELLADEGVDGAMAADALDLLASSAACAVQRLRFLRLALGPGTVPVAGAQLKELSAGFLATPGGAATTPRLDWQDAGAGPWEPGQAKLLLNMISLARDSLPRGGIIGLRGRGAAGPLIAVVAEGVGATPGEAATALAQTSAQGLGPRGAQAYYAACLARRQKLVLSLHPAEGRVVFEAQ